MLPARQRLVNTSIEYKSMREEDKSLTFPNRLAAFLYKFHAPLTYIISIVTHIHTYTNDVHNCTQKIFICLNLSCFVAWKLSTNIDFPVDWFVLALLRARKFVAIYAPHKVIHFVIVGGNRLLVLGSR